jgi:hypothetical protein
MNKHLTDEQIQLYLDPNPLDSKEAQEVKTHLQSCKRCQKSLQEYRVLYKHFATPLSLDLSGDFRVKLQRRIALEMKRQKIRNFMVYGLFYGAGIAGGLGLGLSYIDYDAISREIANDSVLSSFTLVFDSFQSISLGIDIPWGLLATVISVLVLLYIFDHFVLQQFRHLSIFK